MAVLFPRLTVLENRTEGTVEFRECPSGDPEGTSSPAVMLGPNARKLVLSRKYHQHCIDSGIPRSIKLFSNGVCFKILTPNDFICNKRIAVRNDENGQKVVTFRVRATPQGLFFIKALACFNGDITGRAEEPM